MTNLLYALPELSLILGIINLSVLYIFSYESSKVYAKTSRLWLLVSLFFILIFYDKSYNLVYFTNTSYTMLFKVIIMFFTYITLIMSPYWFATENKTGYKYLIYILSSLVTINLLISSINLISYFVLYTFLTYINYRLLKISQNDVAKCYIKVSMVVVFMLLFGCLTIYNHNVELLNFNNLKKYITAHPNDFITYISSISLLIPFLYLLGVVPFHLQKEDIEGKSILPVAHFFAVIIPILSISMIIRIKSTFLISYENYLSFAFMIIGILSVIWGSIGANSRINLHRIYAHGSMYNYGLTLILLSFFTPKSDFVAFLYFIFYLLALNSLYAVFYNLKSHGEFLSSQISLSGLAQTRPHITRALLISIFSFLGFPPFVGFLSCFGFINEILNEKGYILLLIILLFFLILAKSYLEIIKTAYFEQKMKSYDAENKIILLTTVFCMFLIVFISFNPLNLIEKIKDMFYVIYI